MTPTQRVRDDEMYREARKKYDFDSQNHYRLFMLGLLPKEDVDEIERRADVDGRGSDSNA